jgi:hypothetical protein
LQSKTVIKYDIALFNNYFLPFPYPPTTEDTYIILKIN